MDIDIVIPFVDCSDPVWQKARAERLKNNKKDTKLGNDWLNGISRYRDTGTLELVLLGIKKYMPWYHKIYLIVSHKSQVPSYAKNCEIILHKDFIPNEFCPVFSSSAIETWMGNLKVLEHFIWFNDDIIPIRPLKPTQFFTDKGTPKYNIYLDDFKVTTGTGHYMRLNDFELVTGLTNTGRGVTTDHGPMPYRLSWCQEFVKKYNDVLYKRCYPLGRNMNEINQWAYAFYQMFWKHIRPTDIKVRSTTDNGYSKLNLDNLSKYHILCLNDSVKADITPYVKFIKDKYFRKHPMISLYERL